MLRIQIYANQGLLRELKGSPRHFGGWGIEGAPKGLFGEPKGLNSLYL